MEEKSVQSFDQYVNENAKRADSAGLAIVLANSEILLVHPTNGSWTKAVMSIPKGKMEEGEDIVTAAIRETFEETGIRVSPDRLEREIFSAEVWSGTKFMNHIHYLICRISDPSEIGLDSKRVPKSQLQAEEVDWAGFVTLMEAYGKVPAAQRIILDRLR